MALYLIRRLLRALIVVLVLTFAVFVLLHLTGDPAVILAPPTASASDIEHIRHSLGLDAPEYKQYARFLAQAITGNFGISWQYQQPALDIVLHRLPATVELAAAALTIGLAVGIPLGMLSAARPGKIIDFLGVSGALAARSMPSFWLGLMLIILFGVTLKWLPTFGAGGLSHLILPAVTLSAEFVADIMLLTRSGLLEVLGEDYIRTARAKGIGEFVVFVRHALPNAALPIVGTTGVICSRLIGGAVITEIVFAWPGVGALAIQAVNARDFPLVEASVIVLALCVAVVNVVADLCYGIFNRQVQSAASR